MLDTIKFTSKIDCDYFVIGYNTFKLVNKAPLRWRFIINFILAFMLILSLYIAYKNIKGTIFIIFTIALILKIKVFPRHVQVKSVKNRCADEEKLIFEIDEGGIAVVSDDNNCRKSDWGKIKAAIFSNFGILLIYNNDYMDLLRFSDMNSDMKSRLNKLVRRKVPKIKDCN